MFAGDIAVSNHGVKQDAKTTIFIERRPRPFVEPAGAGIASPALRFATTAAAAASVRSSTFPTIGDIPTECICNGTRAMRSATACTRPNLQEAQPNPPPGRPTERFVVVVPRCYCVASGHGTRCSSNCSCICRSAFSAEARFALPLHRGGTTCGNSIPGGGGGGIRWMVAGGMTSSRVVVRRPQRPGQGWVGGVQWRRRSSSGSGSGSGSLFVPFLLPIVGMSSAPTSTATTATTAQRIGARLPQHQPLVVTVVTVVMIKVGWHHHRVNNVNN
mmetsp:Transcript_11065/g.31085  ORF Transcript_11065/g.31085 Transcript_11065/m.31085 type:complete len:273 (+) Transcript_11065:2327-3145(+)